MSKTLVFSDFDNKVLARVSLLDVDPDPSDPDEPYFTTLDIQADDPERWLDMIEGVTVENQQGELLTPDHGDEYLDRLSAYFRSPYLQVSEE